MKKFVICETVVHYHEVEVDEEIDIEKVVEDANRLIKMSSGVEALNDAPGIYSARYAETPQARIDKLLNTLDEVEHQIHPSLSKGGDGGGFTRRAKFVCAMTLVSPDGKIIFQTRGECHGEIAKHQSGTNGFGYDPIFLVNGKNATMAELSEDEKNKISHRGKALRNVLEFLSENKIS